MDSETQLRTLERKLRAQDRTIEVLTAAVERSQRQSSSALTLLRENAALELAVRHRTRELEAERERLQDVVADLGTAEAELLQAQKLTAIGQLAAGIAHEINTPMQFVGDNVEFLRGATDELMEVVRQANAALRAAPCRCGAQCPLSRRIEHADMPYLESEIPAAFAETVEGIRRVVSIVQAMKQFSHPSDGHKTLTDVHQCIESTVIVSRNAWKYTATLKTDFDASCPKVPLLRDEFNQVILNLIVNAAHAIEEATGASDTGKGTIVITTRREEGTVLVQVRDSGTGIPADIRERIFDPFFTTKPVGRGTGQGLAIARSVIVDKHLGDIGFDSNPGGGTTFWLRLPIQGSEL